MSGYRVSTSIVEYPQVLEQEWCDLQRRAECSYFQSWGWIGVWLRQIAADLEPVVVRVHQGDRLVGLAVFVHRDLKRRLFFASSALYLNEAPFGGRNMTIEYNGILAETAHRGPVYAEVIRHLFEGDRSLDEVFLGAVDSGQLPSLDIDCSGYRQGGLKQLLLENSSTWAVDLDSIGDGRDAYLETLSKNRRAQIRRSFRMYEASGSLVLEQADDHDMAMEFMEGLKELHTERWQKAGKQGVFSKPLWERFHKSLVETRFSTGEIQLLRVRNDDTVIGYLYNLLWRNHVYVIQTGFISANEKGMMPGYVVHAMAIEHNRKLGMAMYDLMHGDELYKRIMCKRYRELLWVVVQRPRLRFRVEQYALAVKRFFFQG